VLDVTAIVDHGPQRDRFNIVVLPDGYRRHDMDEFHKDVDALVERLSTTQPFSDLWNAINIIRIDVASKRRGVSDSGECGGGGKPVDTYFKASFCETNVSGPKSHRLMSIEAWKVIEVVEEHAPQYDQILVIANDDEHVGGRGGLVAVTSKQGGYWFDRGIHEIAHGFDLDDEYGNKEEPYDPDADPEGLGPNVAVTVTDVYTKWGDLIEPSTCIPTWTCAQGLCADFLSSANYPVGAYEGAKGHRCGVFRPEMYCKMRFESTAFCAVCMRVIAEALTLFL
jgi:hypothetical protein